ncbi:MAG: [protein-PII] uridylyltransferase [Rhodocyclaceae bacterium]|nr:[protein-PII] uridylyltransferase [Rhodocyclaceae bacterium]
MTPEQVAAIRSRIAAGQAALKLAWQEHRDAETMLRGRANLLDDVLREVWSDLALPPELSLIAVGGYGGGKMYPYSDVDLLILIPDGCSPFTQERIESLVGLLWDIGLDLGHSVRTAAECLEAAAQDITVQTALLEGRFLTGNLENFQNFQQAFRAQLDPATFLSAKRLEQSARYAKYNDTPFSLEPNCKESPGGLRDIQVLRWVSLAANLGENWQDLVQATLIDSHEALQLEQVEMRLAELRIELHLLVGRREERLLFDYQEQLARAFAIEAAGPRRASEILMQRYYRNAKRVTQLNVLLLSSIAEWLQPDQHPEAEIINDHFQTIRSLLDVRDESLFHDSPKTMLECFRLLMARSDLKGLTPRTQRALWRARGQIDATFSDLAEHRTLFLDLFKQKHLIRVLRQMNQYGILGRYLPAFGRIVGQMQHDLFHVYTVDQHILQVMRNLRRFAMPEFAHEYPFCSALMTGFERPWILYLAALFHDIAKGRGGDHSKLGMDDAREFCVRHEIDAEDTELIVFLVEQHLLMSAVAQKQDLSDPDVIAQFSATVATARRLTALYLLTVADIRGTSPKVWNAWKGKLLEDLYRMTMRTLQGEAPVHVLGVPERQDDARRLLRQMGLQPDVERDFWTQLDTGYFMRHDAEEIAWHTRHLYYRMSGDDAATPLVRARVNAHGDGIQVMIYTADQEQLFTRLCGVFAQAGYTIVDAKIHTTKNGYALDSFVLLHPGDDTSYRDLIALLEHELMQQLQPGAPLPRPPRGRLSRQVKHFPIAPQVSIRADEKGSHFLMSISASDRPGLLYAVARVLAENGVRLHTAKIATLGERVEDIFLISGRSLGDSVFLVRLEQAILAALADQNG